jgi:hypothetical protein
MARSAVYANRWLLPDACQARADVRGSSSRTNSPCSPHRRLGWCVWLMLGVEIEGVDIESLPLAPNQIKISQEGRGRLSKCMQLEQALLSCLFVELGYVRNNQPLAQHGQVGTAYQLTLDSTDCLVTKVGTRQEVMPLASAQEVMP